MFNNSKDVSNAFLEAIDIISDKKVNSADFTSTIKGTIIECKDASIGKYLIKYQNSTLQAYAPPNVKYPKNVLVYINVPNGDLREYKTILGTFSELGSNYIEDYIGEEYYDTGKNFIDNTNLLIKLSSFYSERQILYKRNGDNNIISLSENIENEIKNGNFLKISGTIQTQIPFNQQYNTGRYGIEINIIVKNSATGNPQLQSFYFDSINFEGNPYLFTTATFQQVSYPIDSSNFVAIDSIIAFVEDFPLQEDNKDATAADIIISNLTINGSYKLDDIEKNTVGLILKAKQGYTFNVSLEDDEQTRTIEASLRVKMKEVNLEEQGVRIYWFKQDLKVTPSSPYFLNLGGLGWKCINPNINSNELGEEDQVVYNFNPTSSIVISSNEVLYSKQTRFKCIAVYDNKIYSKDFIIFNNGATYEVTLQSTEGTEFSYSTGHPNLICRVWGYNNGDKEELTSNGKYIFYWQVCNNQNITTEIKENLEEKNKYLFAQERLKDINNKIGNSIYWNDKGEEQDYNYFSIPFDIQKNYSWFYEEYKKIIIKYINSQRPVKNILYNVDLHQIINNSTFRCSCYEINNEIQQLVGTATIVIKNTQAPREGYSLMINHGDQVFLYNQDGSSLHNDSIDSPYEIFDLSYTLFYNGTAIQQQDLNGIEAKWKVPCQDTMLIVSGQDENQDYIYVNGNTLKIDVNKNYNSYLSNNDIYLILPYKEQVFTVKTNFTFSKEGENGTNGTKYYFKIKPQQGKDAIARIDKNNKDIELILQPELWYNGVRTTDFNQINWKVLKNILDDNKISFIKNFNPIIDTKKEQITFSIKSDKQDGSLESLNNDSLMNIIEAECKKNGFKYYANLPIITLKEYYDKDFYFVDLDDSNFGFRYVTYKNDGTNPSYDNRTPFKINIFKKMGSNFEDVSLYNSENFNYQWKILPEQSPLMFIDFSKYKKDQNENVIFTNICKVIPNNIFTKGNQVSNAVFLTIKKGEKLFAEIHIPIHFMLNKYENRALNDWNGTSIEINNEQGYILMPQVGAGHKENNNFTGVILGDSITKVQQQNSEGETIDSISNETGLFGYGGGVRTIFLDAETGNATFGNKALGQILIRVDKEALIQSQDYSDEYYMLDNDADEETKKRVRQNTGMQIQFSNTPHIRFGSGNFSVEANGFLTAKGGGNIAGWQISDDSLSKGRVKISSDNRDDEDPSKEDNTKKALLVTDATNKDIFSVDYRGFLHSQQGDIAGWIIQPNKLYNENVGLAPHNWIYKQIEGDDEPLRTGVFWAGEPDKSEIINFAGIHFAKRNFFVTEKGLLYSKAGNIGSWNIAEEGLYSADKTVGMSSGKISYSYVINTAGENVKQTHNLCFWGGESTGKNTGKFNFWVSSDGYLFSRYGMIGNWYIGENGLYQSPAADVDYKYQDYTWTWSDKTSNFSFKNDGKESTITTKTLNYANTNYTYETSEGGIYIGSDGMRFGSLFHVSPGEGLYAYAGKIGGITINQSGLSATHWKITGDGTAYFSAATINGSDIVQCNLSGSAAGGGVSGGGMRMGSGGAGTSYMSPQVKTGENGDTWEDYINNKIKDVMTKNNIISILKGGTDDIDFGCDITGTGLYSKNIWVSGDGDVATENYVKDLLEDYAKKSDIPSTPPSA